jgi:transformation/transcription domain-associated protein
MSKDDPIMAYTEKLREIVTASRGNPAFVQSAAKLDVYIEIATKLFPDTILRDYFTRSSSSASDLWHTRKQITLHLAAFMFQTYLFSIGRRLPAKLLITRSGGQMHTAELVPDHQSSKPEFSNNEPIPFRLTPNIQTFLTPIGIEGVLVTALTSIARCLTESEVSCCEHSTAVRIV